MPYEAIWIAAHEEYLKQPTLAYQGKMFQDAINGLKDADASWVGKSDVHIHSSTSRHFLAGTAFNLPDGYVLTGVDFFLTGTGDVIPYGVGGKLEKTGYISDQKFFGVLVAVLLLG